MLACFDVQYFESHAVAAGVIFAGWHDAAPPRELTVRIETIADYVPGEFYRRELPCLLAAIQQIHEPLETIIIDGYVYLGANKEPGLGAKLYQALTSQIPVVGVAKTRFAGAPAMEVLRGTSTRPLLITAAGMDPTVAAGHVRTMQGNHRIPTLLGRVDRLCRS